jgi:hypothetical protein
MAVGYLTSSTLIASVKRRALIPSNQKTFQDADFLALANEEIDLGLVPSILSYHEEYFSYEQDVALNSTDWAYKIPSRAIGNKFRDLAFRDSSGTLQKMVRIQPENRSDYNGYANSVKYFYIRGSEVVLVPEQPTTAMGSLVFLYYLRPNDLVVETRVGTVISIDKVSVPTQATITLNYTPTNIVANTLIDFIQAAGGHKTLAMDINVLASNTLAGSVTINITDLPAGLVAGDQVAAAGECSVPQVPSDLHSVLAQRVAARCLEALGDTQGLNNANSKLQEMEVKTGSLIDNRSEGNTQKVVNKNGLLSKNRRRW